MDPPRRQSSILPNVYKFRLRISHAEELGFKDVSEAKKKKYTSNWRVVITSDNGGKKATPIVTSATGNPHWDTELDIKCHPHKSKKPITLLVIDSEDHHVGQIFLTTTDDISPIPLPGVDPLGIWLRKCQELEPTKKNSYPQGRLYYWAWALEYLNESSTTKKADSNILSPLSYNSSISSRDLRTIPACSQSLYSLSPQLSNRGNLCQGSHVKSKHEKSWKASLMHLAHIGSKRHSHKKELAKSSITDIPSGSEDSLSGEPNFPPTKEMSFFHGDGDFKSQQSEAPHVSHDSTVFDESKKSSLSSSQPEQSPTKNPPYSASRGLLVLEPCQGSIHGGYSVTINSYICPLFKTPSDVLSVQLDCISISENLIQWLDPYVLRISEMPAVKEPCRCIVVVETRSRGVIQCQQPFIYAEVAPSPLIKLPVLPNEPTQSLQSEPGHFSSKVSRCASFNEDVFSTSKDSHLSDKEMPYLNTQQSVEVSGNMTYHVPSKRPKPEFLVGSKSSSKGSHNLIDSPLPSSSIKALASATILGTFSSRISPEERMESMQTEILALREKNTNLSRINQELEETVRQKETDLLELSEILCGLRNRLLTDNLIEYLEVQK